MNSNLDTFTFSEMFLFLNVTSEIMFDYNPKKLYQLIQQQQQRPGRPRRK